MSDTTGKHPRKQDVCLSRSPHCDELATVAEVAYHLRDTLGHAVLLAEHRHERWQHSVRLALADSQVVIQLAHEAESLIAIGYSFNPHDRASYDPVLRALAQGKVVIVSPEAVAVAKRLATEYPELNINPIEKTFGSWATDNFASRW